MLGDGQSSIVLVDPVGYLDMLSLQRDAAVVVTDSGGIQEEACMLHTPCVTVRRNTERQITLEVGLEPARPARREEIIGGSGRGRWRAARLAAARALGRCGRRVESSRRSSAASCRWPAEALPASCYPLVACGKSRHRRT